MNCAGSAGCLCGCCAGTSVMTPQSEYNAPRLPAISYRAGTWATFKESMLARLSSSDYPALAPLKTRSDDDFTIAFLDATAVMLDILTFYQERLANESYLRTAVQLRSLTEICGLTGYQPGPGVAASTYVAFTVKSTPGQAASPIVIPRRTQMQSVPAQGQKPQTFETSEDIQALGDWSALPVQTSQPWIPPGGNSLYLSGTSTQLQLGDSLLILGAAREGWAPIRTTFTGGTGVLVEARILPFTPSDQWEVVVLNKVHVDKIRDLTYVSWDRPLSHASGRVTPSQWSSAKVFAFRKKAALFGNNAPNPSQFVNNNANPGPTTSLPALIDTSSIPWGWSGFHLNSSSQIDLDATYSKIVVGSWFAMILQGMAQLYRVMKTSTVSLAQFALSGRVTELAADYEDPNIRNFTLPLTEVWTRTEELTVAGQPLDFPLYGRLLDLAELRTDLAGKKVMAISGNRQKIAVADGVSGLLFSPDDGSASVSLKPDDVLTLTSSAPPLPLHADGSVPDWPSLTEALTLLVEDANGRRGAIANARLNGFVLVPSGTADPVFSECVTVTSVANVTAPYPHTRIVLQSNLINCYDRYSTRVNANVGLATHGQSVSEILGSGSASTPNQRFQLKQSPLTYTQALTPTGRQSTLQVRANGVAWKDVHTLYQQSPSQAVFTTLNQSNGSAEVIFGDGVEGATLPTGQNNVQANYRIGLGAGGNVRSGALTTLMDRPLGVTGVINPNDATGGQDPEPIGSMRSNAPQTVLTLGRAVSITDYQSFAATFAGIAKAHAIWIPSGPGRGVFLTVAGAGGAALPPGNPTLENLVAALRKFGNPLIPISAVSFQLTPFGLSAYLAYDPAYDAVAVQAQVRAALASAYGFEQRSFGQAISVDEVASIIQAVAGVSAVTVATLRTPSLSSAAAICPYVPIANIISLPQPAEVLVLNPDPAAVVLGMMS